MVVFPMSGKKMKNNQTITHNNHKYIYDSFYKRLESVEKIVPGIICPKCLASFFQLKYGEYEIIAVCNCGHEMVVYDG